MTKPLRIPPQYVTAARQALEALCGNEEPADVVLDRYEAEGAVSPVSASDFSMTTIEAAKVLGVCRSTLNDRLHRDNPLPRNPDGTFDKLSLLRWDSQQSRRIEERDGLWGRGARLTGTNYHDSKTALFDGAVWHCAIEILLHDREYSRQQFKAKPQTRKAGKK